MTRSNYIATAICDGLKRHYTVHNVTKAHATRVANRVAKSLFCAECVSVISLTLMR